jgi:hypothetical protein
VEFANEVFSDLLYTINIAMSSGSLLGVLLYFRKHSTLFNTTNKCYILNATKGTVDKLILRLSSQPILSHLSHAATCRLHGVRNWLIQSCQRLDALIQEESQMCLNTLECCNMSTKQANYCVLQSGSWRQMGWTRTLVNINNNHQKLFMTSGLTAFLSPFSTLHRSMMDFLTFTRSTQLQISSAFSTRLTPQQDGNVFSEQELIEVYGGQWQQLLAEWQNIDEDPMLEMTSNFFENLRSSLLIPALQHFDSSQSSFGWRGGSTGEGVRLFVSLQTRIGIVHDHLAKVTPFLNLPVWEPNAEDILIPDVAMSLFNHCTCDSNIAYYSLRLVEHCNDYAFRRSLANETTDVVVVVDKLYRSCMELLGLVSLVLVERFVFAVSCSAAGLLQQLLKRTDLVTSTPNLRLLLFSVYKTLSTCSRCTNQFCDSSFRKNIDDAEQYLRFERENSEFILSGPVNKEFLPVLVINLDRRLDR